MRVVLGNLKPSGLYGGKEPFGAGRAPLIDLNDGEIFVGLFVLRPHALHAEYLERVLLCDTLAGPGYLVVMVVKSPKLCGVDAEMTAVISEGQHG